MPAKKSVVPESEHRALMRRLKAVAPKGEQAKKWELALTSELVLSEVRYCITSGIAPFDSLVGGVPIGRVLELYGLEGCGKTAMAIRCAARAMKGHVAEVVHREDGTLGFNPLPPEKVQMCVVYIDNEGSLDDDGKLVVDGERLDVVGARVDTTDDLFKMIQEVLEFQKERIDRQKDDGIFRGMLIVVDTLASTSTRQELEQKWGTQDFPRQPQQISRGFRQLIRDINRYQTAVLLTNQARVKFNTGGGTSHARAAGSVVLEDYTSVGGMALRFYSTQRVFMYATNQKYKLVPSEKFPSGMLIGFSTVKNRNLPPWRTARLVLLFGRNGGFHDLYSRLETLVQWGFVEEGSEARHTDFVLKFNKHGIQPETFDLQTLHSSLEEDEEAPLTIRRGGRRKEPGFKIRAEWPGFYEAHKADVDRLWQVALVEACKGHTLASSSEDLLPETDLTEGELQA